MSLSSKLPITDVDLKDKRVLIRVCCCSNDAKTRETNTQLTRMA